eukprot:scpid10875/ scgid35460/ 
MLCIDLMLLHPLFLFSYPCHLSLAANCTAMHTVCTHTGLEAGIVIVAVLLHNHTLPINPNLFPWFVNIFYYHFIFTCNYVFKNKDMRVQLREAGQACLLLSYDSW